MEEFSRDIPSDTANSIENERVRACRGDDPLWTGSPFFSGKETG